MKISDIINELSVPNMATTRKKLADGGYTQLDNGDYSTIWWKPGSKNVLKLFWLKDKAYIDFTKLAMSHSNNPHFPRFKGKLVKMDNDYAAIRMEKLDPLDYDSINSKYANLFDRMDYYFRAKIYNSDNTSFLDEYPELKEACDLIYDNLYLLSPKKTVDHGYYIDFHPGNVMLRGDTIVIIDPVNQNK